MKTTKPEPGSKEFLDAAKELICFMSSSGKMIWRRNGTPAGVDASGCQVPIAILGKRFSPQHVAWMFHRGEWSAVDIGFRNGINTDFRIENLFEVITDKQVTITKSGPLYVVLNGTEQVLTTQFLDLAVQMVRDILEG